MSLRLESTVPWLEPRTIVAAMIATAAVWSTATVVDGWKAVHGSHAEPRTISVVGRATKHVVPDRVTWTVTLHNTSDDRTASLADLGDAVAGARDYLLSHGITAAELQILPATTERQAAIKSDGEDSVTEPGDFDAAQQLVISSDDIPRVLRAYRDATTAAELSAGTEVAEPSCSVSGVELLEQLLVTEARRDAHARAEAMVADYGDSKLGRLVGANAGDFDPMREIPKSCTGTDAVATATATYELE